MDKFKLVTASAPGLINVARLLLGAGFRLTDIGYSTDTPPVYFGEFGLADDDDGGMTDAEVAAVVAELRARVQQIRATAPLENK